MRLFLVFFKKFSFVLIFLVLEIISIALVFSYNDYPGAKWHRLSTETTGVFLLWHAQYKELRYAEVNNRLLQRENLRLREQVLSSQLCIDHQTQEFRDSTHTLLYTYIPAKVRGVSSTRTYSYLVLDAGEKSGIKQGMAVITDNGVVGLVTSVSTNFSLVMSIKNRESKISAKIAPGNYAGSLMPDVQKTGKLCLFDVPSNFDIKLGDTVFSSGYSLSFPEGIPIGRIKQILSSDDLSFHKLEVELFMDFSSLSQVYVVKNKYQDEIDPLVKIVKNE